MLFKDICYIDEQYNLQQHMHIVTEGTCITYIGKEYPLGYAGDIVDGSNKLAAPGFFNIHCHSPMSLLRGFGEGLPLDRWLAEKMLPFEKQLSEEDIYWGCLLGISEMISSGVVSFTDMYYHMVGMCKAVEDSGIKANLSHGCSAASPDLSFRDVSGWQGMAYLMQYTQNAGHDRIVADAAIHAEYTSAEKLCKEIAQYAAENNLRIHLHLSETKKEHDECKLRRQGKTPAQWFESLGVFDLPVTAAHCVWVEEQDMEILADKGVTVAHNPTSNLKLGSGIAPITKMLDHGIRVGIGTDGAASNNNLNMLEEISLASLVQKGITHNPLAMGTKQTMAMACKNGALSQGRKDCGAIKVGNRADIVLYNTDLPSMIPNFDPLANLLYSAQASALCLSMIDGKVVYKDGEFKTIDIEQVKYNACRIATSTAQKLL